MKKAVLTLLFVGLVVLAAAAEVSSPEGLTSTSGDLAGGSLRSFSVMGEGIAGVISGSRYISTVGLASVIFTPLVAGTGGPVPTVNTAEVEVISYPNPFSPTKPEDITIAYKWAQDIDIKLYIFDITGQLVRTITASTGNRGADGLSRVSWDGRSGFNEIVDNGVYLARIVSGGRTLVKTKLIVVK